jgi:hypothetical protein
MNKIKWKENGKHIADNLHIPEKRKEELEYRLSLICHEMEKPVRKGQQSPTSDIFIKLCIALAENEQELIFCSYIAGNCVERIFDISEDVYEEDEP